jgi:PAS domain S-box-containing protein
MVASLAILAAWVIDPGFFRQILTDLSETKPDTALGFFLLAISLLLLEHSQVESSGWPLRAGSRICAFGAALIGALASFAYWTGSSNAGHSGAGMSPVTALNLILMGAAIFLMDFRWGRIMLSPPLTWAAATISFLTLTGIAYDRVSLVQLRMFTHVSIHSSLAFLVLCAAVMFVRPEDGVAAILLRRDLGGEAARRMLPAAIFIPFAASMLILKMRQTGSSGTALMVFLFLVAPVTIFVPLVLYSSWLLSRMETERRQGEEELRANTRRFSSVVASAMDAIITLDESLRVIVFNEAAEKMFGIPSWEALGKPLDNFLPAQIRAAHEMHIRKFGEVGVTARSMTSPGILTAVRANGEHFPIEATISHVEVAGQKLYTVILRDITGRKHAEETLRQSEARFRSIYEQAAVGIEQVAPDGKLLMVNAALCRMLGYEESDLLGRTTEDITHPDDYARETELIHTTRREHQHSYEIEKRYRHRDGSLVWVHVTSSAVNSPAGEPLYRIAVIQNLTERKRAEEQLLQVQKMEAIGRLAGGVAHDFNTLLNVMLGYSELLLAELALDDPRREHALQIWNSGSAGALLTKQLLSFSRKQGIAPEVLDLREVASHMTPMLRRLLRDDIELSVRCAEEVCTVKVDPGQIQQLVLNLVANAGDAMPNGGSLSIEVRTVELDETYVQMHSTLKVGRYALLTVSDTGEGMSAEVIAHVFEPFFTTKDAGQGTGLGLATVYGIVKRNGGDIWVYSEVGVGTIFKVYLPLTSESLPAAEASKLHSQARGAGETILLVEDSAALRELTKVILTRDGYKVLTAEDGVAALEVSRAYPDLIHLVLTDVVMPRMRGPELAEEIVKQRPGISVVFFSGNVERATSQLEGFKGYRLLEKPYTAVDLLRSVRHTLDDSSSRDAVRSE